MAAAVGLTPIKLCTNCILSGSWSRSNSCFRVEISALIAAISSCSADCFCDINGKESPGYRSHQWILSARQMIQILHTIWYELPELFHRVLHIATPILRTFPLRIRRRGSSWCTVRHSASIPWAVRRCLLVSVFGQYLVDLSATRRR